MSSLIERLTSLVAGQPIYANDINSELNQLVNLLSGISTDKRVVIVLSSATKAPLTTNQTGSGDLYKAQKDGVDTLRILNNGQIKSTLSTGTAPIVVASTTKCTNLNADLVGGINSSALVRNDTTGQILKGNIRIKKLSIGTYDFVVEVENDTVFFYRYNSTNETRDLIFQIDDLDQATRIITLPNTVRVLVGYEPTDATDIVRKQDLENRSLIPLVSGLLSPTPRGCAFVAPQACVITRLSVGYISGTPSGDCTIDIYKNAVDTTQGLVLTSSAAANTAYSTNLTPIELVEGDKIYINATSSTGHTDIFATLTGYWVDE